MNKELIRSRFSKNLVTYHENAKIQKRMAEKLVDYCNKKSYPRILEIGCGTGFLTECVNNNIEFESYVAIDIVNECSVFLEKINPNIVFKQADIEAFLTEDLSQYDLIISNAALQWVEDFEKTITNLINKLNPEGELIFTTFGKENFREIFQILGTTLDYYSKKELFDMFESYKNFSVDEEVHIVAFETPKDVLKHLQLTGVNSIENVHWTKKDLRSFENMYANFYSKRPTLTYNPLYVHFSNQ
ncbi:malonyl-ACP O-methyltransferase BioC [bacterium]|nr:malonyl-ACP O-methyltransferase BioC [bacterium]